MRSYFWSGLGVLAVSVALVGCDDHKTTASAMRTPAVPVAGTSDRGAAGVPNDRLTREVRHELVMLPYYSLFDWLQFKVNDDDSVVLLGQVTRPSTKSDAERRIKKLEEVSKVSQAAVPSGRGRACGIA